MAAMHVLPHIHTMNPSYAHIDPAASLLAAAHPEAGPSYTRTSPRTQPAPVQTYGNVAQDWEYFESADGANTGGTSPSGSSVGTPVSDAALSHPQIVGSEPYQTEKFPALTYPSYEQWMYDAPPPAPSKSSLHGAVGDTYTYAADDREAVLVAASAYTGAGSAQASSSSHLAPANYAGASAQVPAYYPTHPPSYTGQRTVTVSYTVNVTARAPYAASRHPQAQAQGQMYTHQPLLPAPVYHHHHHHPHQQQQQMQAYPQMLTAHHHHHPHQYQPHQQQHQHAYVPALAQTQPQQHHHLPAPTTSYQHHPSYQPPVPQAASFAPELPPLYHPKPQHSLPEWVHDQSAVCPEEPRWDGPQIEAAPSEEEADEMDDDDESGDEDGDEDDDGDDGESDDAGEEMQDMVVDMCAGVQEGTLPPSSLLCQPISDSVRAQFAAVAAPPRTVPVAPAQRMYWH